jgi:thiol-disulfide isomerase/thioredoxin
MNIASTRKYGRRALTIVLTMAGIVGAADQPTIRAVVKPSTDRKAAPEFALKDSSGKTRKLRKYRGKVILLDFWATWCTGCKKEIPWFSEFQRKYAKEGLAVIGVSMDEDGWKVVKPFLAEHPITLPTATRRRIHSAKLRDSRPAGYIPDRSTGAAGSSLYGRHSGSGRH